mmetsp:Transcript_25734/g.80184  ORF Transcript_25734/g.80184 Transcript_25734/m.80184 type:complete len:154 (+) Transcript_25734:310-771(+)
MRSRVLLAFAALRSAAAVRQVKQIDLDKLEAEWDADDDDADWGSATVTESELPAAVQAAAARKLAGTWDPAWDDRFDAETLKQWDDDANQYQSEKFTNEMFPPGLIRKKIEEAQKRAKGELPDDEKTKWLKEQLRGQKLDFQGAPAEEAAPDL